MIQRRAALKSEQTLEGRAYILWPNFVRGESHLETRLHLLRPRYKQGLRLARDSEMWYIRMPDTRRQLHAYHEYKPLTVVVPLLWQS